MGEKGYGIDENRLSDYASQIKEIAEMVRDFSDKKVDIVIKNSVMNNEYTGNNSILLCVTL